MGASVCFCCFKNQGDKCVAITGLITTLLAFGFLIWGVSDLEFKRSGVKAIYIITFIFVILILN